MAEEPGVRPARTVVGRMGAGRPRLDGPKGHESPVVRARLPEGQHDALVELERSSGRSRSDLLREAVGMLLRKYGAEPH